jgi:hypothetical protein
MSLHGIRGLDDKDGNHTPGDTAHYLSARDPCLGPTVMPPPRQVGQDPARTVIHIDADFQPRSSGSGWLFGCRKGLSGFC